MTATLDSERVFTRDGPFDCHRDGFLIFRIDDDLRITFARQGPTSDGLGVIGVAFRDYVPCEARGGLESCDIGFESHIGGYGMAVGVKLLGWVVG